jgi:uncharacterized protein (DUF362 family)
MYETSTRGVSTDSASLAGTRSWLTDPIVAIHQSPVTTYSPDPPFHPDRRYPEAPFADLSPHSNPAYGAVRAALWRLGLDSARWGSPGWNPLGDLIRPGEHVVLKPNLIRESHTDRDEWEQVVTHGSVIRAALDYVFLATGPAGRVTIADGPQTDSDFSCIRTRTGLDDLATYFARRQFEVAVMDLRREQWLIRDGVIAQRQPLPGDPLGYVAIDLGDASAFMEKRTRGAYYGADYAIAETAQFHNQRHHEYIFCRTPMDADVFINLPKLKVHKKVGVTLSLKNLVGINGYRNCLPHFTFGTPDEGGDEFAESAWTNRIQSRGIRAFKWALAGHSVRNSAVFGVLKRGGRHVFGDTHSVVRSGNWYGNDTAWRMTVDLNRGFMHFDADGQRIGQTRRYFTIVDGIVGGEGNGPLAPDRKEAGLVVAGFNPVAVDTVCATLMGFDCGKLPLLTGAWHAHSLPLAAFPSTAVRCVSNVTDWEGDLEALSRAPHLAFRPHFGWIGAIERAVDSD